MAERDPKPGEIDFVNGTLQALENPGEAGDAVNYYTGILRKAKYPETKSAFSTVKRLVGVGQYRIVLVVRSKIGRSYKLSASYHLYELIDMSCKSNTKVILSFQVRKDKSQTVVGLSLSGETIPQFVQAVRTAYLKITCGFPPEFGFTLHVPPVLQTPLFLLPIDPELTATCGPCDGFIETYLAQCNYIGLRPLNEVIQFIIDQHTCSSETFQLSTIPSVDPLSSGSNTKPNSKKNYELIFQSIFLTLNHNTWFKSFNFDNISKNLERSLNHFFQGLRWNQTVAKISLRNLAFVLSEDSIISFRNSIVNNDLNNLQVLDFSETTLGGRGAEHIAVALEGMNHGFKALRLQNCGVSAKGLKSIFVALCRNFGMSLHMLEIDCSHNKFDEAASKYLMSFLERAAKNNGSLRVLKLRDAGKLDVAGVAKCIRDLRSLTELDLSCNKIEDVVSTVNPPTTKEPADGDYAVALLAHSLITVPIQHLRLSGCSLTGQSTGRILTAVLSSKYKSSSGGDKMSIDISENGYKDSDATIITETLMGTVGTASGRSIDSLNLSGSKFKDKGLIILFQAIPLLNSITTLILDRAIDSSWSLSKTAAKTPVLKKKDLKVAPVKAGEKKPKKKVYLEPDPIQLQTPTENIASALLSLTAGANPLKHLSLSGPGYRYILSSFLSFSSNSKSTCTLDELDISNNGLGDSGAMVVAEFLRGNSKLKGLNMDRNGVGSTGYLAILSTLMYNHTLQYFRYPVVDYDASFNGSSADWNTNKDGKHINIGGKTKLKETLFGIQQAIESNSVAARGYFDVADYINKINSDRIGTWGTLWTENHNNQQHNDQLDNYPPAPFEISSELLEYSKTVDPETIGKALSKEEKKLVEAQTLAQNSNPDDPNSSSSSTGQSSTPSTPNLHGSTGVGGASGVAPSSSTTEIAKEAHVNFMAKGGLTKSWSVRYCVLERNKSNINRLELFVWKDLNEAVNHVRLKIKPKYKIDLYLAKIKPLDTPGISKSPFGIEIHTRSKTFYMMTEDKPSMQDWLFVLKNEQTGAIDSGVSVSDSKKLDGTKSLSVETTTRVTRASSVSGAPLTSSYGSTSTALVSPRNTSPLKTSTSSSVDEYSNSSASAPGTPLIGSSSIAAAAPSPAPTPAVPNQSKPVRKMTKSNLPNTPSTSNPTPTANNQSTVPLPSAPPMTPLLSSISSPVLPTHSNSTPTPSVPSAPKPKITTTNSKPNPAIENAASLDALLDAHYDAEGLTPSPPSSSSVFTQSTRKHTQKSNLDDLLHEADIVETRINNNNHNTNNNNNNTNFSQNEDRKKFGTHNRNETVVGRNKTMRGGKENETVYKNFYAMENPPPAPVGEGPPVPKVRDWVGVKRKVGEGGKGKKEDGAGEDLGSQLMTSVAMRRSALKEDEYGEDSDNEGWESD